MRKTLLLLIITALPLLAFSQAEGEKQSYIYNIVSFTGNLKTRGFKARLDDGKKVHKLKDENGKKLRFRTPAAALTYFSSQGWEIYIDGVTSMNVGNHRNKTESYWIIRKPCTKEELAQAAEEGLKNKTPIKNPTITIETEVDL